MRNILIASGIYPSDLGRYGLGRSNGVTKIVWHGAAKKGNLDLCVSKNTLEVYHVASAAGNFSMIFINAYFANYPKACLNLVKAMKATVSVGKLKNGVHFRVRHWTSIKKYNQ